MEHYRMKLMKKLNKIIVILVKKRILVADRKFYHRSSYNNKTRMDWQRSRHFVKETWAIPSTMKLTNMSAPSLPCSVFSRTKSMLIGINKKLVNKLFPHCSYLFLIVSYSVDSYKYVGLRFHMVRSCKL